MAHSERFEELAAARALDLPLGEEAADFARHLDEGCPTCEELLSDFRAASSALAFGVPPRAPRRGRDDMTRRCQRRVDADPERTKGHL